MSNASLVMTAPSGALAESHAKLARRFVGQLKTSRWLAEGAAYEIIGEDENFHPGVLGDEFALDFPDASIDINSVSLTNRKKKLLVADMESTIIEQECLDELAEYVGLRDEVSRITEQAMRGELDFESALRERVGLLKGLSTDLLDDLYASKVTLMPGAETLVATMAENGAHCALVSGGFTHFTSRIANRLGFHSHQANELVIENGKLTGEVCNPILGRAAKKTAMQCLCADLGVTPRDAICVGDGANDLDMLTAAGSAGGIGVAFRAKPIVASTAPHRVNHSDLTALLYLQGYRDEEVIRRP